MSSLCFLVVASSKSLFDQVSVSTEYDPFTEIGSTGTKSCFERGAFVSWRLELDWFIAISFVFIVSRGVTQTAVPPMVVFLGFGGQGGGGAPSATRKLLSFGHGGGGAPSATR